MLRKDSLSLNLDDFAMPTIVRPALETNMRYGLRPDPVGYTLGVALHAAAATLLSMRAKLSCFSSCKQSREQALGELLTGCTIWTKQGNPWPVRIGYVLEIRMRRLVGVLTYLMIQKFSYSRRPRHLQVALEFRL